MLSQKTNKPSSAWTSKIEGLAEFDNHESIFFFYDRATGLKSFISIHNSKLGPAVGGTRMFLYSSETEALSDVLRLSKAMTYKCALAGVSFGGGKSVIINDPQRKNKKILKAYAQKINTLNGNFYTGQDMGISKSDVGLMLKYSDYFIGKPGLAEDPAPYAALSTFYSIQTAMKKLYGSEDLNGKTIAIKGVGNVGMNLIKLLAKTGAKLIVADIDKEKINKIKSTHKLIAIASPKVIHKVECDIYSPCAMGKEFNFKNVKQVKASVICGGANNQLTSNEVGNILFKRNILFIPDYVANAGGLINVVDELESGGYKKTRVLTRIENIKKTLKNILDLADRKNIHPNYVSDQMAKKIIGK